MHTLYECKVHHLQGPSTAASTPLAAEFANDDTCRSDFTRSPPVDLEYLTAVDVQHSDDDGPPPSQTADRAGRLRTTLFYGFQQRKWLALPPCAVFSELIMRAQLTEQ